MIHLEQQRDFEDLIEGEQEDADLQPGRRHDPLNPTHQISDSDDSEISNQATYQDTLQHIQLAQTHHQLSSSSSSDPDVRRPLQAEATSEVTVSKGSPSTDRSLINYDTLEITDYEYPLSSGEEDDCI